MRDDLTFLAGSGAFETIREEGLKPERVRVIPGAAGGPKWLVLNGLDRLIFGRWLANPPQPIHLIGASIGAWRFAAAAQADPEAAVERFEHAYIHQRYDDKPTPQAVSAESVRVLDQYLKDDEIQHTLNDVAFRLNIITVRCRDRFTASRGRAAQGLGLALAAIANGISRKMLGRFFESYPFSRRAISVTCFP